MKPVALKDIPPPVGKGTDVNVALFANTSVTFVVSADVRHIARIVVWEDAETHEVQVAIVGGEIREIT